MTPKDSQAKVVTDINMTESLMLMRSKTRLYIVRGVRQGNTLSITLFNLALNYIIKTSDIRGNTSTAMVQIMHM